MSDEVHLTPPVSASDHAQGSANAPITLVEYGDYECPHCGTAYPIVKVLQQRMGGALRFVFRNFPLAQVHPDAIAAAELTEAAALQGKFWQAHDTLFENQSALGNADLSGYAERIGLDLDRLRVDLESGAPSQRVRDDFRHGVRSGVNGTPTFFINGRRFDGNWADVDAFVEALQQT